MEISQFAESILFGKTLEEKLISPQGGWTDESPTLLVAMPEEPGRTTLLTPVYRRNGKFDFPKVNSFGESKQRAKALHYFANHELEAMELMALALLKFSDAPKTYRLALTGIITEEQKHLKLYLKRMRELGINFGDHPVSGFFWKSLAKVDSLKRFTAAMNLTLEQANLDHCIFFRDIFSQVGDHESAAIMGEVLTDEIGHVRHGVNWFKRWQENESLWNSYLQELPPEITPARARGRIFSSVVRQEAGFDVDFINNVEVYTHSKGRVPDLFYFYPFVEYELALGPHGINIPRKMYQLKTDLEVLPAFIAKTDDLVAVEKTPSLEFLQNIKSAGFSLPQFLKLDEAFAKSGRRIREFKPWGWCYHTLALQKKLDLTVPNQNDINFYNKLYAKTFSLEILRESKLCAPEIIGSLASTEDEVIEKIKILQAKNYNVVIKAVLGASGQNQIQIKDKLDERQGLWLRRLLKEQGGVIVEPWLNREFDFSMQVRVFPNGQSKFLGYARFISDETGKYRGAWLGGFEKNLTKEQIIFINNAGLRELTQKLTAIVAARLAEKKYVGTAGIDCFVYRDQQNQLRIKPLVEINVRSNMGEVTVNFSRRLVSRRPGLWVILGMHELKKIGFNSFKELALDFRTRFPLRMSGGLIESGVLFTNDPEQAEGYLSLIFAAANTEEIKNHILRPIGVRQ